MFLMCSFPINYSYAQVNQIEFHFHNHDSELIEFCRSNNIVVMGWSPFAKGRVFSNESLCKLATTLAMSVAELSIRWSLSNGIVTIP
jgi:diketogulonate reductase-like aldo/keto reductase